jgi:3-isopropylmalate/(R)-2-methylmalate dehydratase small subunit
MILMESSGVTESFRRWDEVEIDVGRAEIKNLTTGAVLHAKPLPDKVIEIISKGGVVPYLKNRLK